MQNHIIRRQILHLRLSRENHAWSDEQEFVRIFREHGMTVMEKIFDELVPVGKTLRLDKLEIDLGRISLTDNAEKWREIIASAMYNALQNKISEESTQSPEGIFDTPEMSAEKSWVFFLEHGTLPWWALNPDPAEWEFSILTFMWAQNPARLAAFIVFLKQHPQALQRLLLQNSAAFQWELLQMLFRPHSEISKPLRAIILKLIASQTGLRNFLRAAWEAVLAGSIDHFLEKVEKIGKTLAYSDDPAFLLNSVMDDELFFEKIHPQSQSPHHLSKPSDLISPEAGKPLYLQNAGLVSLAPFIPSFFKNLGYIKERDFVDSESRCRAAMILHYLATGKDAAMEYELTFEKFLCNAPAFLPFDAAMRLNDDEIQEADDLLLTAIAHWSGLGACSPGSFREMFLVRPGKLSRRESDWLLHVENSSFDILFRSLPWGISMIRMPWMKQFLNVEWTY